MTQLVPASLTAACLYRTAHTFSMHQKIADIKALHDATAEASDVIWVAGGGEFSRILSLSVEFYNPSPQHVYVRAQIPEAYKDDVFSLYTWHNLQRPRNTVPVMGAAKGKRKKKRARKDVQDASMMSQYIRVAAGSRTSRKFRAWSRGFTPRWLAGESEGETGVGPHLLSFVPFAETLSVAGTDLSKSNQDGLEIKVTVTFLSPQAVPGNIKGGAVVLTTAGYARLDFVDPPPALDLRVHDLAWTGGPISYAVLNRSGSTINLNFFDKCGSLVTNPIGLNSKYIYTCPLGIVDEIQGTQKESVVLFNQIGFVGDKWVYGSLVTSVAGQAIFQPRTFSSDPGLQVLAGDAKLVVYSTADKMAAPVKLRTAQVRGLAGSQRLVTRVRGPGEGLDAVEGASVLLTAVTVVSFILEVLRVAVTTFDAPERSAVIDLKRLATVSGRSTPVTCEGCVLVSGDACSH